MTTHKTEGIVLHYISYGETSIIVAIYTEIFGVQSYIIKGVRKKTKQGSNKLSYFQPGNILDLIVYNNPLKNLQYIQDYQWNYIYKNITTTVVKNLVVTFCIEFLRNVLTEQEANVDLYFHVKSLLQQLDEGNDLITANFPMVFIINILKIAGFQIQSDTTKDALYFDLESGTFSNAMPFHNQYISGKVVENLSLLVNNQEWTSLRMNSQMRNNIIENLLKFCQIHIPNFKHLKSYHVLKNIFS